MLCCYDEHCVCITWWMGELLLACWMLNDDVVSIVMLLWCGNTTMPFVGCLCCCNIHGFWIGFAGCMHWWMYKMMVMEYRWWLDGDVDENETMEGAGIKTPFLCIKTFYIFLFVVPFFQR